MEKMQYIAEYTPLYMYMSLMFKENATIQSNHWMAEMNFAWNNQNVMSESKNWALVSVEAQSKQN